MSSLSLYTSGGTQAVNNLLHQNFTSSYTNSKTGVTTTRTSSMSSILAGIDGGFNTASIFSTDTGLRSNNASTTRYSKGFINDEILKHSASIPKSSNPYPNGAFGASIISNYLNSISRVETGGDAPISVLEQRLNYHLPADKQLNQPGKMYGDTSNFFNVDSVAYNKTSDSSYNHQIKTTGNKLSAGLSGSTSNLMSLLA